MKKENVTDKFNANQPMHNCRVHDTVKIGGYGIAIDSCWESEKDNKLWVGNGEYANTVNYCPFCGYKGKLS